MRIISSCYSITVIYWFLGAFGKFRKATVSFVMSFCLSVRLTAGNTSVTTGRIFMKFDIFFFRKSVAKIPVSLKSDKNSRYFTWRPIHVCDNILLNFSWKEKCARQKFYRKSETHILCSVTFFFRKSFCLWDNVEKYCTARKATDDNMARVLCILGI